MAWVDTSRVSLAGLDLRDAVDLAMIVEEEARARYEAFSRLVGGRFAGDADDVFRAMADVEGRHLAKLRERRRSVFGDAPRRIDAAAVCDVEAPEPTDLRPFMGPGDALRVALDAETRGWEFFDGASRAARDVAARTFLEEIRDEDAERCRALLAWRREIASGPDAEPDEVDPPGSDPG